MFEIQTDAMFEVWDAAMTPTGAEAEDLSAARFACTVLADEGYDLPLTIVAPDGSKIESYNRDDHGNAYWKTATHVDTQWGHTRAA